MRKLIILSLLLSIIVVFTNCKKDKNTNPTTLTITIGDDLGYAIQGASVTLYKTETDWSNGTNPVGTTLLTDSVGKVKFTNLSSMVYYWFAEKGCKNNANGLSKVLSPLKLHEDNNASSILTSTGTVLFVNTSNNPYDCYVNGTRYFTLEGKSNETIFNLPAGSYTFRVLQLNASYPIDESFPGNLICGGNITITFP